MTENKAITSKAIKDFRIDTWKCTNDIKEDVVRLISSLITLKGRWVIYNELFLFNEKRIELLNDSCGRFFGEIQHLIIDFALLELAKFAEEGKKTHGSLKKIHERVLIDETNEKQKEVLSVALARFYKECNKGELLEYRNKYLAHNDEKMLEYSDKHWSLVQNIGKSINLLNTYLNLLADAVPGISIDFGFGHNYDGQGECIVYTLLQSDRYSTLVKEEKVHWGDIEESPYYKTAYDDQLQKEKDTNRGTELVDLERELHWFAAEKIKLKCKMNEMSNFLEGKGWDVRHPHPGDTWIFRPPGDLDSEYFKNEYKKGEVALPLLKEIIDKARFTANAENLMDGFRRTMGILYPGEHPWVSSEVNDE